MAERPIHVTSTGSDTDGLREFPDGANAGLLIPTHTTAQRNSSPSTGEIAYNSTLAAFEFYNGSSWVSLDGTGATTEAIQDIVGAMFTSNTETNISATYEDSDGTIDLVSTDTTLTTEAVQDIVGAMFTSNTETRISATYEDSDGTIDLVVTDMTADTQLSTEAVQDIVGAMFTSNTETNISATYEDSDGTIDLVSTDTTLTTEAVQDIVGAMFTSNTETRISATYQDADGTIDLVADDMTADTQLTTEAVQDIVGAMFTSNTETRIAATYEDSDGTIDLVVTDMTANDNTQLSQEQVEDFVGGMLGGTETFISVTYQDGTGDIDFVVPVNDEDDMSSDSAAHLATQQSIKAYVDSKSPIGKQSIWVPATAMNPTSTNGCAAIASLDSGGNTGPDLRTLDFDDGSDEHAQFSVAMPSYWNEGTVTFKVYWTSEATDTDGCAWGLSAVALADSDSLNTAFGTAVVVTDDAISAAKDLYITAESGAVTVAGSPAAGELCYFNIFRDVSDGNDDMAEDAKLIGIKLFYTADDVHEA